MTRKKALDGYSTSTSNEFDFEKFINTIYDDFESRKGNKMSTSNIHQLYGTDAKSLVGIPHEDALKIKLYAARKHRETFLRQIQHINTEECGGCEILLILFQEIVKLDDAISENMAELDEMGISYLK